MTCREGDKESLLYFDSHNKFMTQCLKGRRIRRRRERGEETVEGSSQVVRARQHETRMQQEEAEGGQKLEKQRLSCGRFGVKYAEVDSADTAY